MTQTALYSAAGVILFCLALYAFLAHPHLLRKILAINIAGTGVSLLLAAQGNRGVTPDPVPQALIITGIVVLVGATAFGLALACRLRAVTGLARLPDEDSI